jgi:hypothetical protein
MEPELFHRNGDNGLTLFKRIDAATSWPLETDVDRIEAQFSLQISPRSLQSSGMGFWKDRWS